MVSPYRNSSGPTCPRCHLVIPQDDTGDYVCTEGCGAWMAARPLIDFLGDTQLNGRGTPAPFFKVTPLPSTCCFECSAELAAHYRIVGDRYLTLGQCTNHGIWIEGGTRDDFCRAFDDAIRRHRTESTRRADPEATPEKRIAALERQVASLLVRIERLERR